MDVYDLYYEKDGYRITVHQVKPYFNTKTIIEFPVTLTYLGENEDLVIGNVGGISRHSVYYSDQELMGETVPYDMWDVEKMGEVGEVKSTIRPSIYLVEFWDEYPTFEEYLLEGNYTMNIKFQFTDLKKDKSGEWILSEESDFKEINCVFDFKVIGFSNILDWAFVKSN
jgi:hypothetical protein